MTDLLKRFRNCSLENYNCDTDTQKRLVEYLKTCIANNFEDNIIIMGGVGLGKTHIAYAVVNALEEIKQTPTSEYYTKNKVYMTTIKTIIDDIRKCWKPNADDYDYRRVNQVKTIPLLIIDEIGIQYGSESERIELFDIFNYRYNEMLPTIVISNCNKQQMGKILGQRIIDRLFGSAKVFEIQGKSKR